MSKSIFAAMILFAAFASSNLRAEFIRALTSSNQMIGFDSFSPGTITSSVAISGLLSGDMLVSIDRRPATGMVFGFAVNGSAGRVYSIDEISGQATLSSELNVGLDGDFFSIDFNPTVDRLRVVSDAGQNLRANVDTGVTIEDGDLAYADPGPNAGVPPAVFAAAYTNSVANATTTSLYGLEGNLNSLVLQSPPNAGVLTAIGSLSGILFPEASFDISGATGTAYAILNGFEFLHLDLATGQSTFLGTIGSNSSVVGFTAQTVPEPSTFAMVTLGVACCTGFRVRRRAGS